jgi:hypothetical protein
MPSLSSSRLFCLLTATILYAPGCGPQVKPPDTTDPVETTATAPAFTLRDLGGVEHRPFTDPRVKALALIFVLSDCPIANGYAPEINRLCRDYSPRGVRFFLVHTDSDLPREEAARHARDYGYLCPVVLDGRHTLVRRAGATVVPEAAVFTADGQRKYRGRIDDRYLDLGQRRAQVTSHDLREALDDLLAGRPVRQAETKAVGCDIPPLSEKEPAP